MTIKELIQELLSKTNNIDAEIIFEVPDQSGAWIQYSIDEIHENPKTSQMVLANYQDED